MADVKWIKLATDIFDDEKILLIEHLPEADSILVIWLKLLCFAGKQNNNGVFTMNDKIAYTDEMLATIFRRPINTVRLALDTFKQFGMIEVIENVITIPNWEKHQNVDKLDDIKEYNRVKQRESRARKKKLIESKRNVNDKSMTVNENVNLDIDKDIDIEVDKEEDKKNSKAKRFTKPSLVEIQDYCSERNNNVNPQRFFDYYESNGWKVGKNPMKDWKAAIRTWERNDSSSKAISSSEFNITKFDV